MTAATFGQTQQSDPIWSLTDAFVSPETMNMHDIARYMHDISAALPICCPDVSP